MERQAKPRSKAVKTRDGSKSTVQAPPTLEEYRAVERAARARDSVPLKPKAAPEVPGLEVSRAVGPTPRPRGKLIRSSGNNLPQSKCSRRGELAHQHPVGAVYGQNEACLKLVVFRDDDDGLTDEIPEEWGPEDGYDDSGYGEDDEAPSWLPAAGISRQEWEDEQRAQDEESERIRDQRRLDAETEAMTAQWRSEVADKPRGPLKPNRR